MKTKYVNMSDEELQTLMNEKQTYIDKLFKESILSWDDFYKEVDNTNLWEMEVEMQNRQTPELRDSNEFELECRESYESFKNACKNGYYKDWDGNGYYGTETQISDIPISCRAFENDIERTDFNYVYWFNK